MCRFVKQVIVHRRPRRSSSSLPLSWIYLYYRFDRCRVWDFARNGEKRILGVTFKENPIGMNSNGVRASSFFPSSSPSSYLLPPRGGMFLSRGLWLGVPGEMTPQMEPLWRWSPRVEPREDTMKEKKEREKEWGKEKNNYTVRESVSMKVCSPSVYRESVLSATRSRWKFILSTYRTRARNYRAPRKTWMELGIL